MMVTMEKYKSISIPPLPEFTDAIPVMYAPLKEYVINIIPLILQHIWHQKKINNSSSLQELIHSGWICRLITLDNRVLNSNRQDEIKGWTELRGYLIQCIDDCRDENGLALMTDNCMKAIQPVLQNRFIENYHFPQREFHCWWYTIHEDGTHLALHLINAYQPESPFDHLYHFQQTMLKAVEHALVTYPPIRNISCGSWLNQLPKFQQLWPESFLHNQKVLNETGGFGPGAWGQYMTTNGGFNHAKAGLLLKTGKHPFALTESYSTVEEVTDHLKKLVS